MQQITNVSTGTSAQARPAVAVKVKVGSRLAYIDYIRMVLIIMVILMHTAITYGAFGDWTYHDPAFRDEVTSIVLSLVIFIEQAFFMSLFFFLSGAFTPGSYDKKGAARFWKDRLLRLAIPMVIYTYFLSRIPNYIEATANNGNTLSFWQYSARTFLTQADGGPTWFLFALLLFSAGYTIWRFASRGLRLDLSWASRLPAPGTKALLALGLIISAGMFAVVQATPINQAYHAAGAYNLLLAFFPAYILFFTAGLLAYRNDWLTRISGKLLRFWGWFSAAMIVALPILMVVTGAAENGPEILLTGLTWRCALTCLWFGFTCVALCTTVFLWLRERIQSQNRLAAFAGPNSFAVYLIHPIVLVPICYGLSLFALPAIVKFGLSVPLTVVICYALADILRRLPGARAIL